MRTRFRLLTIGLAAWCVALPGRCDEMKNLQDQLRALEEQVTVIVKEIQNSDKLKELRKQEEEMQKAFSERLTQLPKSVALRKERKVVEDEMAALRDQRAEVVKTHEADLKHAFEEMNRSMGAVSYLRRSGNKELTIVTEERAIVERKIWIAKNDEGTEEEKKKKVAELQERRKKLIDRQNVLRNEVEKSDEMKKLRAERDLKIRAYQAEVAGIPAVKEIDIKIEAARKRWSEILKQERHVADTDEGTEDLRKRRDEIEAAIRETQDVRNHPKVIEIRKRQQLLLQKLIVLRREARLREMKGE